MRVDFYRLNAAECDAYWHAVCRITEKAYLNGHTVFIACDHLEDVDALDDLLWAFKPTSFVPHGRSTDRLQPRPPVLIGLNHNMDEAATLLINLTETTANTALPGLARIIEIIREDDAHKAISREHYRVYRQQGHEVHVHHLT